MEDKKSPAKPALVFNPNEFKPLEEESEKALALWIASLCHDSETKEWFEKAKTKSNWQPDNERLLQLADENFLELHNRSVPGHISSCEFLCGLFNHSTESCPYTRELDIKETKKEWFLPHHHICTLMSWLVPSVAYEEESEDDSYISGEKYFATIDDLPLRNFLLFFNKAAVNGDDVRVLLGIRSRADIPGASES